MGFFFQAEDGIRDRLVTGVQTCALPICPMPPPSVLMRAALGSNYSIIAYVDGFKRVVHSGALVQPDDQTDVADVAICPNCSGLAEHEVLRRTPRGPGEDLLAKCMDRSEQHTTQLQSQDCHVCCPLL